MGFYYVFSGWKSEICFWSEVDTHLEQLPLFKIIDIILVMQIRIVDIRNDDVISLLQTHINSALIFYSIATEVMIEHLIKNKHYFKNKE